MTTFASFLIEVAMYATIGLFTAVGILIVAFAIPKETILQSGGTIKRKVFIIWGGLLFLVSAFTWYVLPLVMYMQLLDYDIVISVFLRCLFCTLIGVTTALQFRLWEKRLRLFSYPTYWSYAVFFMPFLWILFLPSGLVYVGVWIWLMIKKDPLVALERS